MTPYGTHLLGLGSCAYFGQDVSGEMSSDFGLHQGAWQRGRVLLQVQWVSQQRRVLALKLHSHASRCLGSLPGGGCA
jgi:hypothetical protein